MNEPLEDTDYFLADGTPYRGQVFEDQKGKSFGEVYVDCWKCNASGRSRRGGSCSECRGERRTFDQALIFTRDQYEQRLKGRDRRNQKKMTAEADRLAAILERHEQFVAGHSDLFRRARRVADNTFIADLLAKSEIWGGLTEAQTNAMRTALDRMDDDAAFYAKSGPIGADGESVEIELVCRRSFQTTMAAFQGRGMETVFINELADRNQNAVSIISRKTLIPVGSVMRISGVIKGTDEKRGWCRTLLTKPSILENLTEFSPEPELELLPGPGN